TQGRPYEHNAYVGGEDRAMLRSNLSARADARAWAAIIVLLLIPPAHAWAGKAINLPERHTAISPISATTWLPSGTIFRARYPTTSIPVAARFALTTGYPLSPFQGGPWRHQSLSELAVFKQPEERVSALQSDD
ncbi:MAG TPA: hypothetical protein VNM92_11980, partial [Thermoanaerobaculia bacterium]|nr:hypothetical protein [Thermoanaerobaculia bacterium]